MNRELKNYELNRRRGNESLCLDPLTRLIRIEERNEFMRRCSKVLTPKECEKVLIWFGFISNYEKKQKPSKTLLQKVKRLITPIKIDVLRKERLNKFNDA